MGTVLLKSAGIWASFISIAILNGLLRKNASRRFSATDSPCRFPASPAQRSSSSSSGSPSPGSAR